MDSYIKIYTPSFDKLVNINEPFYYLILLDGNSTFSINEHHYMCDGKYLVFLSPYQFLKWEKTTINSLHYLSFHGDFYCIEYHKEDIACNGILFNNIYTTPYIHLSDELYNEVIVLLRKIQELASYNEPYNQSIVKTYLQLILALSSKEKQLSQEIPLYDSDKMNSIFNFQHVLETHFIKEKSVAFYAEMFNLSVDAFSKKVKKLFGKTPSVLIQERIILEAKKKLHLTYKSIKEISNELGFEDEFYFSRFFKKHVAVSPKKFRENVGISIVAKKSM